MRAELEFDSFYVATRPRLLRQLTLMTLDAELSGDALQEAYVRAWQRWDRISAYEDPEGWVRTVAYRHCVSAWRRLVTARRAAPSLAASESVAPVATAEVVAVRRALAQLSYDQRAVLVLHEMCDLPLDEIGRMMRVPSGTVKSRLARGRAALADLLRDEPEPSPSPATPRPPRATGRLPRQQVRADIREVGDVLGS